MKFENIKVGDQVLIPVHARAFNIWRNGQRFLIARTVERTTKTQFVVNGRRYKKDNGREIGSHGYKRAIAIGETLLMSNKVAQDQTAEYEQFKREVKAIDDAVRDAERFIELIKRAKTHEAALELATKSFKNK